MRGFWRLPGLWLLVFALLAAVLTAALVPVPNSASDTTKTLRTNLQTLLDSLLVAVLAITVQSSLSRLSQRRQIRRDAYSSLMRAAKRLADLDQEEMMFPNGRFYTGSPTIVAGATSPTTIDQGLKYDPFEKANALAAEVRALSDAAEVALVLEEGPDEPALKAWQEVDQAYWDSVRARTQEKPDIQKIQAQRQAILGAIDSLYKVCNERIRAH
jgi:hypothetical protein